MYSSGVWVVKKGHEEEFARSWQASADQLALEFSGVTFRLLRDVSEPTRFVAFSGPWRNIEQLTTARSRPPFQELLDTAREITDSGEVFEFELAAEVS